MKRISPLWGLLALLLAYGLVAWWWFLKSPAPVAYVIDENDMLFIEGGTYTMGASSAEEDMDYDNEKPAHTVTLSSFYLSKYVVTIGKFAQFVQETGYLTDAETGQGLDGEGMWYGSWTQSGNKQVFKRNCNWRYDEQGNLRDSLATDFPVLHVTQNDAMAYCNWLATKTGKPYRLPTEAEWEYAARGGNLRTPTLYSGSDLIDEVAWYAANSGGKVHPVGLKKPNELGLYDMSGLVWEVCLDAYLPYPAEPQVNPCPKGDGFVANCATRGGSWTRYPSYARVSSRIFYSPFNRGGGMGFRVAYSAEM